MNDGMNDIERLEPVPPGGTAEAGAMVAMAVLLASCALARDEGGYDHGRLNLPFVGHATFGKRQGETANGSLKQLSFI